jgi:hypothetical protein
MTSISIRSSILGPISLIKLHDYDSNHKNAELGRLSRLLATSSARGSRRAQSPNRSGELAKRPTSRRAKTDALREFGWNQLAAVMEAACGSGRPVAVELSATARALIWPLPHARANFRACAVKDFRLSAIASRELRETVDAAKSVGPDLLACEAAGRKLVPLRESGQPVAFEDECWPRLLPLSH